MSSTGFSSVVFFVYSLFSSMVSPLVMVIPSASVSVFRSMSNDSVPFSFTVLSVSTWGSFFVWFSFSTLSWSSGLTGVFACTVSSALGYSPFFVLFGGSSALSIPRCFSSSNGTSGYV